MTVDEQGNYPGWIKFWGETLTAKERFESTGAMKKAYAAGYEAASSVVLVQMKFVGWYWRFKRPETGEWSEWSSDGVPHWANESNGSAERRPIYIILPVSQ